MSKSKRKLHPKRQVVRPRGKKVTGQDLDNLRAIQEDCVLAWTKYQELEANRKSELAEVLKKAGEPITTSVVCLDCGLIRRAKYDAKGQLINCSCEK